MRFRQFLVFIIATISFYSCSEDLDQIPFSSETSDNFYLTQNDFKQARNAVYSAGLHNYPVRLMELSEIRSDNIYSTPDVNYNWLQIQNFHSSIASNSSIQEAYTTNYNAIYKANLFLEKLKEDKGQIFPDNTIKDVLKSEVLFVRAFCYFDLIRWFGPVPLVTSTLDPKEAATVKRSPVNEVYDKVIIPDLEFAISHLPESYDDENFGRVTKYAAEGMLALVYMTRSSSTYGIKGPGLGLDEWGKAYNLLDDVVTNGGFEFGTNYKDIYTIEGNANKENVFVIPFLQNTGKDVGTNFMSEHIGYDAYFASLGLSDQGASEGKFVSTDLMNDFEPDDLRKEFGIATTYQVDNGRWKGIYHRPVFKKYADVSRYGDGRSDWGVDFIVLRFTDILMLRAECILHGGGGTQAMVDDIVNKVRNRAGLSTGVSNINLNQLFDCRRKEFFAEGKRWFTLYRTGKAVKILNNWRKREDKRSIIHEITNNYLIYPIPLSEMLASPGLYKQNPGY